MVVDKINVKRAESRTDWEVSYWGQEKELRQDSWGVKWVTWEEITYSSIQQAFAE